MISKFKLVCVSIVMIGFVSPAFAAYERQNIKVGAGLGLSAEFERLLRERSNTAWNLGIHFIPTVEFDNSASGTSDETQAAIDASASLTDDDLQTVRVDYNRLNLGLRHYMKPYRSFYVGYGIFHTAMSLENELVNARAAYTGPYGEVGYNLQIFRLIVGLNLQLGMGFGGAEYETGAPEDLFLELPEETSASLILPTIMLQVGFAL